MRDGFFHVEVDEESKKYLSFITPTGQYEFNFVPFGFCNSPPAFSEYVAYVFAPLIKAKKMRIYIDDGIIMAKSEEEAFERLKEVLERASRFGIKIKWKKCSFLSRKVDFLGYEVENGAIRPSPSKAADVLNFIEPNTEKKVQRFLGLTSYFRKFVEGFANIAKPLSDLLRKESRFHWGPEQQEAFVKLKRALAGQSVLQLYRRERETELHTDASKDGYGAILLQLNPEDGKLHPVYYYSKKTKDAETRYHSYELEFLAIVKALEKFRVYLLGIPFKVVTDCSAVKRAIEKKDVSPRIARWVMDIEGYNYKMEHRPGTRMRHVDALSRQSGVLMIRDGLAERIGRAQKADPNLRAVFKALETGEFEDYMRRGDYLCKVQDGNPLLVIPSGMQEEIIRSVHDVGHFGTKKTMEVLKTRYWFNSMEKRVKKFIQNCVACILGNRKAGKREGFLYPIPKGEVPLDTIHLDHIGPLVETKKSYQHLLVLIDSFAKFTWIYPTKSTTAAEVLKKMREHQQVYGNPRVLISDRGSAFTSDDFENYCSPSRCNIKG